MDLITYALLSKKKASLINGKVPAEQLPSYIDEVLEFAGTEAFPAEGDKSKIYVDTTTGASYRWSGSRYTMVSAASLDDYYTKVIIDEKLNAILASLAAIEEELDDKANKDQVNSLLVNTKTNVGIVALRDMSPIEHTLNLSTAPQAKLLKYGKNLLPYPYSLTNTIESGIEFTVDTDGIISATGTAELDITCIVQTGTIPATGKYIFSGAPKISNIDKYYMYINIGGETLEQVEDSIQIIANKGDTYQVGIIIKEGQSLSAMQFKPQIEYGQCGSAYEPYKAPIEYTAIETGAVLDVLSQLTPATFISPDDNVITVTYNRDLNRAIAEIQSILSFDTL